MRIRKDQVAQLTVARMEDVRRDQFLALRDRGLGVEEGAVPGDFLIRDDAGGSARVLSRGREVSITTGEGRRFLTEQYDYGRIKTIVDPAGNRAQFARDEHGLLTGIDLGEGRLYRFSHDPSGKLLGIQYPDGSATRSEYDNAGGLSVVTDRGGNQVRYAYGSDGLLASVTDARGGQTQLGYAGWDLPSAIRYPNGDRHQFEYGDDGRLREMRVNEVPHAHFHFEEATGIYEARYADGTLARFQLRDGRIVEAGNETTTVTFEYDDRGQLVREETEGRVVQYLRNATGALTGIITPFGDRLAFSRDRDQRLTGITDWTGGRYLIENASAGPPVRMTYPNGMVMSIESTTMGLPSTLELEAPGSSGRAIESWRWDYDVCDRVTQSTRGGRSRRYRYGPTGRLLDVDGDDPDGRETFELDANGNRVRDGLADWEYNRADQLVRRGRDRFRYDPLGNMTSGVCPRGPAEYQYNGRGQLVAATTPAGVARYEYDAFGRRVRKEIGGLVTRYVWAGQQLLAEMTAEGSKTTRRDYLSFPDRPAPLAIRQDGHTYYLHTGARCEVLCMTDSAGSVVWRADYRAFGQARITVATVSQPWRLAGQYFDEETGLHYALARYYDPELGRFLSMDPLRAEGGSRNFYLYCDGDPINRADPTGSIGGFLTAVLIGAAVGAAIGALVGGGIEMYRQREQEHYDWGKVAKAALLGGVIGAIGGAVFVAVAAPLGAATATSVAALAGIGALAGGASGAAEYCATVALTDASWGWGAFALSIGVGAVVGAVTLGIGGLIAGRAARRAAAAAAEAAAERELEDRLAREAAARAALKEAEDRAARETAERAAKEAEERAAREAAEARRLARREQLATDPAHRGKPPSPKTLREADVGLELEGQGKLKAPITRDPNPAGAEFIDGNGVKWDVKRFNSKFPAKKGGFDPAKDMGKVEAELAKGENVIVDTIDMSPTDAAALRKAVTDKGLADRVIFFP